VFLIDPEMLLPIGLDRNIKTEPLTCRHCLLFPFVAAASPINALHTSSRGRQDPGAPGTQALRMECDF
jgi:hypothetical protein